MGDQLTKPSLNSPAIPSAERQPPEKSAVRQWLDDQDFEFILTGNHGEVAVGRCGRLVAIEVGREGERPSARVMCVDLADEVGVSPEAIFEAVREGRALREVVYRSCE